MRIFDPQNGKSYSGSDYTAYMDRVKPTYSVERYTTRTRSGVERVPKGRLQLLRVDNMRIDPDVANVVLKGAK